MKILLDLNLAPWVETLEAAGFEVLHWAQVAWHDGRDQEIATYAVA